VKPEVTADVPAEIQAGNLTNTKHSVNNYTETFALTFGTFPSSDGHEGR
jgi:hypothetical protein